MRFARKKISLNKERDDLNEIIGRKVSKKLKSTFMKEMEYFENS